ncbi:MAG: transporter substrate-binding domain-containing protein, partial [Desulfobacterales bacterium]|nr:transporter substrate-binding domain-containing protein [Desulfobacterales bacterium]
MKFTLGFGKKNYRCPHGDSDVPCRIHWKCRGGRPHFLSLLHLFVLVFFLVVPNPTQAEPTPVRVAFYNYMPHIYRDNYGQIRGVAVDLIETIAAREGWQIQYVEGNWEAAMENMDQGRVDIIPSASFSRERAEKYDLSQIPFLRSWGAIYFRADKVFRKFEELAGQRVAGHEKGQINKAFQDQARAKGMPVTVMDVEDYDLAFEKLNRGEVDAALVSISYGSQNVED